MELDKARTDYRNYFDWNKGNLKTLLNRAGTPANGLSLVKPDEIATEWNYFGAISRFYADAMLATPPAMPDAAMDILELLSYHWAVTGECCLVYSGGEWRAVRPDYIHPVLNPYNREQVDRFVFVYPRINERGSDTGDARVIEYNVGSRTAYESIRRFRAGWIADAPIGEPVAIDAVLWIDTGDGVYGQIASIVREVIVRMNLLQVALNATAMPILQIDLDSLDDGAFAAGVSPAIVATRGKKGLGLTLPPTFDGEQPPGYVERSGNGLTEGMEYIRLLLGQLAVITGVPDYIFGVSLSNPISQTERILFAGQAKINRFRRQIEQAFTIAGWPIAFGTEPFVTRSERLAAGVAELGAGIITIPEARQAMGYDY